MQAIIGAGGLIDFVKEGLEEEADMAKIALLPGDGIRPEIVAEAVKVLKL